MKNSRYLPFLLLLLVLVFGTSLSTSSSAAQPDNPPDQACIEECRIMLEICLITGGKNGNGCVSVYKTCLADCAKRSKF